MSRDVGAPRDRQQRGPGPRLLGAIVLAILVTLALLAALVVHTASRSARAEFARVCTSLRSGTAIADVASDFTAIGVATSGWGGLTGEPPSDHHWMRHTGLAHTQQCTVDVEPSTQRVRGVHLAERSSFDHCTDPVTYPRRHWLCRIASALDP